MSREPTGRRVLVGTAVALAVASVAIGLGGGYVAGWGFPASSAIWGVGFAVSGAIIDRSERGGVVGRLLMWAGVGFGAVQLSQQVGFTYDLPLLLVASASFGWLAMFAIVLSAFARFPDGDWAFPGARALVGALAGVVAIAVPIGLTSPAVYVLSDTVTITNPWASPVWDAVPSWVVSLPYFAYQAVAATIAVGVTWAAFRRDARHRRQAMWVVAALAVVAIAGVLSAVLDGPNTVGLASLLTSVAVLLIPLSIMVAVTRYRLYEIDRIVSRSLSYLVVVGLLAGVYALLVLGLRSLLPVEGPLPVALSTLAVAFAFFPLARRVQGWVDRRFFRSRYNAAAVVVSFADELRTTLDPAVAAGRAESVVAETFQSESVSVWLAEEAV